MAIAVVDEPLARNGVHPRIVAEALRRFLVAIIDSENPRPLRPGVAIGTTLRRLGHDFEVDQGSATVAQGRTDAVRSRIASANDDHVLVFGRDISAIFVLGV